RWRCGVPTRWSRTRPREGCSGHCRARSGGARWYGSGSVIRSTSPACALACRVTPAAPPTGSSPRSPGNSRRCARTSPTSPATATPPDRCRRPGRARRAPGPIASEPEDDGGESMTRFVQAMPEPADPLTGDPLLRAWLRRHLPEDGAGEGSAAARLRDLAADVVGPLRRAHQDAEAHPPTLVRYDPWGARVDRVETSAGWETLRVAAARHALVALPYLPAARSRWGAAARVVQHALLHLYG